MGRALGVRGLFNIQYVVFEGQVYVIEVNPRGSRTVPFLSKVTGVPMVDLAVQVGLDVPLASLGFGTACGRPAARGRQGAGLFDVQARRRSIPTLGPR